MLQNQTHELRVAAEGRVAVEQSNGEAPCWVEEVVVTAEQMQRIEASLFSAGLPVAALMEKVAHRIADWVTVHYPCDRTPIVGFIVGPGHNGGDALVVARELLHRGYNVVPWCPFAQLKDLSASHRAYLEYLDISFAETAGDLQFCDLIVDGGFGFGLARPVEGELAIAIEAINQWDVPVVSIDVPSGIATDTGEVLGVAIQADHTLCLGLWKLGLFQDVALRWIGQPHLIAFDIPAATVDSVVAEAPMLCRLSPQQALDCLPLSRSAIAHKYKAGHILLIVGSLRYAGAALLAGKGALASGVGMVTIVVPESLKLMVVSQLPEALVIGAPENQAGAIAELPPELELETFDIVACGPGLTLQADHVLKTVFASDLPLILDADGLNWLAAHTPTACLQQRSAPTLLTPHLGEFRRLFPELLDSAPTACAAAQQAAQTAGCTLILKGAISAIAHADQRIWFNSDSTAALARGGSGDVLTGLVAGLAAQHLRASKPEGQSLLLAAIAAVWWHAQAGKAIAVERTVLGCPPSLLAERLPAILAMRLQQQGGTIASA